MFKRLLFSLLSIVATIASVQAQCPTITSPAISTNQACIGDVVTLTMGGGNNLVPGAQTVDWYSGTTPGFDPLTAGTYVGSAQIVSSATPCSSPPFVLGAMVDPCNGPNNTNNGSEENEAILLWSAGGFDASNLGIQLSNIGPNGGSIGTLGPCPLMANPTVSVTGGCVVYGGPTTQIPPNAFVLVFTSSLADIQFDYSAACLLGFPVYVFQNSCDRVLTGFVPGAFLNGAGGPYNVDFGCPGPMQSLSYFGVPSNGANTTAGWTILGLPLVTPCGGFPSFPGNVITPTTASSTIDPLNVTITAADCGQQYYSAVVAPPVSGCPAQTGVGSLSLFVECPVVTISGSETVCVGEATTAIQVGFTGINPPYRFTYSINSVPQAPITTSDNPFTFPFTPTIAGPYTIELSNLIGAACPGSLSGTATVTAITGGPTNPISGTFCATEQPIDLTPLEDPAFPGGTWSGPNVSGTTFDAGVSASGPFTVTYAPPAGSSCATPGIATITIDAAASISFPPAPVLCGPTTYDLNDAFGGAPAAGVWSGPNLTLPSTFNAPSTGGIGATFTFTFTPSTGCFLPATYPITVQAGTTTQPLNATICVTEQPLDLTSLEDPAAPGGTWGGPNVTGTSFDAGASASGPYSITYTPPAGGGCSTPGTSTITVTPETTPSLATATACVSNSPIDLSTLVTGGFPTGSWMGSGVSGGFFDPASLPTGPYTLTFTPTPGTCFRVETTTVTVTPPVFPNLGTATLCVTDPAFALIGLQDPSWPGGSWTGPGVSSGVFNPTTAGVGSTTITYIPPAGQCAIATTTTITVTNQSTPTLGTATVCVSDPLFDLTTIQDPAFSTGTWSGTGVSGMNFNPSSAGVGSTNLTFTPSGGSACEGPSTTTITVTPATALVLGTASLCQTDPSFNLATLVDPSFPNGSWSGPGVSGSNFTPAIAGAGTITVTFTPVAGSCASTTTTTITVTPAGPAQPLDATICAADQPLDLTTLEDPAAPGGRWSGPNVTGTTFNAGPTASGNFTVTYTPTAGGCSAPGNSTITISGSGMPSLGSASVCISDGLFDLFTIEDPAFSSGTWTGIGVSGSFFDPSLTGIGNHNVTFTPTGGCLSPASTTITVSNSDTPVVSDATLCASDSPLDLSTLEDPAFPGGVWSGAGVTGSFFDPSATGTGSYSVIYTSSAVCVAPATSTITVSQSGIPVLATAVVCETETFDLTTIQDPAFPTGTWSGTNVSGTTFTAAGLTPADYTLTFTPSTTCSQASTTDITVSGASPTSGRDTIICAGSSAFGLDMLLNGGLISGTWSGAGVAAGQFDAPNVAAGTYGLTFSPAAGVCALPTTIQVTVQVSGTPTIADQTVCTSSPTIDLNALVPARFAGGVWSGLNVAGSNFDPSAVAAGNYGVTYNPGGACTNPTSITITVSSSITLTLPVLMRCIDAGIIDLTTEDPAAAPGGTWSGSGVTANQFDPSISGAGNFVLTYTPPAGGCATNAVATTLEISPLITVGIFTDTVCAGSGPIDLSAQLDPSYATGSWSGSSVTSAGMYTPTNTAGPDQVIFTPQGVCYSASQFTFDVVGVSTFSMGPPIFTCAPDGQTYIATISVRSTPNNGTIITSLGTIAGSILTITGLVSGTTNSVTVDDAATCNAPITLDISFTCPPTNCTTNAGTLSGGPFQLCSMEQLVAAGAIGSVNDGDDLLFYYLDDDTNPDNGFIDQSLTPNFTEPAGLATQTLFIYALSGDDDGAGGISAVDACRSQSNPVQATWAAPISAVASAPICNAAQNAFTVDITLSGGWSSFQESAGATGTFTSSNVFAAGPFASGSMVNLMFTDAQGCGPLPLTVTNDCSSPCVAPNPGSFANSPLLLCDNYITSADYNNNAILGAGDVQAFIVYADAAGTIELARFPSLPIDLGPLGFTSGIVFISSLAGTNDGAGGISTTCFSESPLRAIQLGQTVQVTFDTTVFDLTPVQIAGNTYTQTSNTGTHTISGFGQSCDSVVNVTVNFRTPTSETINRTDVICNNDTLVIGGQTFTASNPSDTFTIGAVPLDTTYQVALMVLPPADSLLRDTLCFGDSLVIGNLVFNQINQSGTSVLRARSGCDSFVTVELEFVRAPIVSIIGPPSYCSGEDIELTIRVEGTRPVTGDVFVNGNNTGSTTLPVGDNTLSFPATSGFTYRLSNIIATSGGCVEASPRQVSYSPQVSLLDADIAAPLSGEFTACGENTVASIAVQTGNGIGPYRFAWSTGDTTNSIRNVGQGNYSVTITDDIGCTSMTSIDVVEGDTLVFDLSLIEPVCPNGSGSISISLDELPTNATFRFDLPGLDTVTSPDLSFTDLEAGTYVFQLIQENGCEQSTLITLNDPEFFDVIRFDTIDIELGDSARIFLDLPNNLDSIRWFPSDFVDCDTCERVLVSPPFDLEYEAVAYTIEGCEVSDRVFVRVAPVTEIYIPTAFSPNGNGVNDVLIPFGGPEVERIETFLVYDRWGNQVHGSGGFLPGDELYGWDGRHRGELMNPGVFVALVEVRFRNGKVQTFSGSVLLVR